MNPDSNKVTVSYVNHACFLVEYRKSTVLIDPFLSGRFRWDQEWEVQKSRPKVRIKDLPRITCILCTHKHGDHFDYETIKELIRRDQPLVAAPPDVVEFLMQRGGKKVTCWVARPQEPILVRNIKIVPLPNKGSEEQKECLRLSFLIECHEKNIFHSGDSHGFSETWRDYAGKVALACLWCEDTAEIIKNLRPVSVYLHHFGEFSPGRFSCNKNITALLTSLKKKFKNVKFYHPEKKGTVIL